jgi:predicted transcriptional regulator of viral defense system
MSKDIGHSSDKHTLDRLFELAEDQAGYFTARQATEAGISRALLSHHAREGGPVMRVQRGLYRLRNFPASAREDVVAQWLKVGQPVDAVVSHESAAELHGLTDIIPNALHMTVPRRYRGWKAPRGVRFHLTKAGVPMKERVQLNGVPATSVDRTIIDLLATNGLTEQAELAISQAHERGITTRRRLETASRTRPKTVKARIEDALERGGL